VADLARLFHASKRRLGSPGLPLRWFQALLDELEGGAVVHVARRGSEPVAVSMSFVHAGEMAMYYIGTTPEANRSWSATSFLIVELQEWAIRRGLRLFDLGRSRKDAATVKFKRNQGFEPTPLHYRYHLVRSEHLPSFTPSNPRTAFLRRTWSRLPAWAAERLSSRLARYLP
jgi:predicted N-acyltransferase